MMDAWMKTYGHTIKWLVRLGITEPFSPLDRYIADLFILTMTTGRPWGLGHDYKVQITDTKLRGVRVKIYQPLTTIKRKDRSVLIYFHGGGWSLLSVDSYDPLMRKISRDSETVVISVDYRLSPQHPFPEPLNDCLDVVEYVIANCDELGIDSQKIAIGGDSAGGNLAAAISLRLKTKIAMQLVLVPVLQFSNWKNTGEIENVAYLNQSVNSPNSIYFALNYLGVHHKHFDDFVNNRHTSISFKKSKYTKLIDQNVWMNKEYIRDEHLRENIVFNINIGDDLLSRQIEGKITDPMVAPLMAEDDMLEDLPYTYIVTCGYDFIRDDGIMFYERLRYVGADVTLEHYSEGFHNALMFRHGPLKCDVGVRIVDGIISVLRNELS